MRNGNKDNEAVEKAFSSYVKTCLRHSSRDYFRKMLHHSAHTTLLDERKIRNYSLSVSIYLPSLLQVEDKQAILQIINELNLSPVEKKILYLKYVRDQTDKDIANSLGITRQAVSKTKAHTLIKIKSYFNSHFQIRN
ncbi:sigma-70 family RNA polymerase sigma factor [Paenibacillus sonchi]|uniref:Sigma-70 family RNA polymerase sigma factor n=2 Tax=Paenibacillus sonchi TaxID=373687 RepID=A0A974PC85_9BACL|nr:sigma-70 family RNA polymerase sigma factor [Paenibacillus sonchi]QQZ61229.1 sigma-70 family RNA polymerase sigma factor [Paenibacillus sonchi]